MEPAEHDYIVYLGSDFEETFQLYEDSRMKRWRGEYNENWLYKVGDGAQNAAGEAFVAILETQGTEPGTEEGAPFWTPMVTQDLTGCTLEMVCEDVFERSCTIADPKTGGAVVAIDASEFADAPGSAHYYLRLTTAGDKPSFPLRGTMIFRTP